MAETFAKTTAKVKKIDDLATILAQLKAQGKKIAHCHGVFDLLHVGHLRHLECARRMADVLVVTITQDQWVNKGPHRPAFGQDLRAEMLASLECVDYVAINNAPLATEAIKLLKPNLYIKGSDYRDFAQDVTGGIKLEEAAVHSVGGQLAFTDEVTYSSSTLINRHFSQLSEEAQGFLQNRNGEHESAQIRGYLDKARELKIMLIGEAIIDEYHYCQSLGKSGKEPILAVRRLSSEKFAGGVLAVANHLAEFTPHVRMITALGKTNSHEEFIRSKLSPTVDPKFLFLDGVPTIVKERFIEEYPFQKMFEVYLMGDYAESERQAAQFRDAVAAEIDNYDLVIVTDYGHGLIEPGLINLLCSRARCLAVNTQANAGNHGFNTVSKYPRADYICISEGELRLEVRQRTQELKSLVAQVAESLGCVKMTVTRGRSGILCYDPKSGFVEVPAFTGHHTDRVGAGDAVFAITSLCMAQGAPADVLGIVGNAVGAMAVGIVGNRTPIVRSSLSKFITTLFK